MLTPTLHLLNRRQRPAPRLAAFRTPRGVLLVEADPRILAAQPTTPPAPTPHPNPAIEAVLDAFRTLVWPVYVPDAPLTLEVEDNAENAAGFVYWQPEQKSYVVRFASQQDLEKDLAVLLGQVAHVRLGHAAQDETLVAPELGIGERSLGALAGWRDQALKSLPPAEADAFRRQAQQQADDATAWAAQQLPKWLTPIGLRVQDAIERATKQAARAAALSPEDPQSPDNTVGGKLALAKAGAVAEALPLRDQIALAEAEVQGCRTRLLASVQQLRATSAVTESRATAPASTRHGLISEMVGGRILGPAGSSRVPYPDPIIEELLDIFERRIWPAHLPQEPLVLLTESDVGTAIGHSFWSPEKGAYVIRVAPTKDLRETLKVALHEMAHVALGHLPKHDHPMAHLLDATVMGTHREREARKAQLDPAKRERQQRLIDRDEAEAWAWTTRELERLMPASRAAA